MQTIILNSKSKSDLKQITDLAKKIGVGIKILKESEMEEIGLSIAIKEGKTDEYINTNEFMAKLRK